MKYTVEAAADTDRNRAMGYTHAVRQDYRDGTAGREMFRSKGAATRKANLLNEMEG